MNMDDFALLSRAIKERCGIALTPDKTYLLETRLAPVARRHGVDGLAGLARVLRNGARAAVLAEVAEAMTTNETSFFRDGRPFEQLRRLVLPRLAAARAARRSLRIWSAACATGQEPYSIAMTLVDEAPLLAGWRTEILATDIATAVLAKAESGLYSQFEVQRGLPIRTLVRHFTQEGDQWRVSPTIRGMIRFQAFNLLDECAALGTFDVILCRNVLIYFDPPTKTRVLDRLAGALAGDGYLFLGGSETVLGVTERFRPVPGEQGVYTPA